MKTLGDLVQGRDVYHLRGDLTVREAARQMRDQRVGGQLGVGDQPAAHGRPERREAFDEWIAGAKASLDGLVDWFSADRDVNTGIELLANKARQAVLGITHAVERLREAASQPSARTNATAQ